VGAAGLAAAWLAAAVLAGAACLALVRWDTAPRAHPGPWRLAVERFRHDRAATGALCFLAALAVVTVLAPLLAPYSPSAQPDSVALKNMAPALAHPFGTDPYSRDVLSRVLYGARVSLPVALMAILIAITVGTAYGAVAGFYGGRVDTVMMRLIDAALAIPRILLLLAIFSLWGSVPLPALVAVLGLTGWFGVSRLVRAQVLAARETEWATAARALGAPGRRVLWRHVLPNVLSPVIVAATLGIGNVIVLEAGLSYLGFGVQQPTPSWGNIIRDAEGAVGSLWWISFFPGLAIVATVMAFNVVGDGLRDALDPRLSAGARRSRADGSGESGVDIARSSVPFARAVPTTPDSRLATPEARLPNARSRGDLSAP
jgi:peptide/nickel transport system permease protein